MGQPASATDLRNENTFVIPDAWRGTVHPWRGSGLAGEPSVSPDRVAATGQLVPALRKTVQEAHGDADLHAAALAYLDGAADPVGAAVVAALHAEVPFGYHEEDMAAYAHRWVRKHGLAFAATAAAELGVVFAYSPTMYGDKARPGYLITRREASPRPRLPLGLTMHALRRVRELLAVADEQSYRDAVAALADHRRDELQRAIVAYLVPTETAWVDEVFTDTRIPHHGPRPTFVFRVVRSVDQLRWLRAQGLPLHELTSPEVLHTVTARIGPAIAPLLAELLDDDTHAQHGAILDVLGALPTDEAFSLLLARLDQPHVPATVLAAAQRYPMRALRLLSATARHPNTTGALAARLLHHHAAAHPDLVTALPAEERATVATAYQQAGWVAEAPADALPRLLVDPPWTRPRKPSKPVVVKGLVADVEPAIVWADGERDQWAAITTDYWWKNIPTGMAPADYWDSRVKDFQNGHVDDNQSFLFIEGPAELVRPLLTSWVPEVQGVDDITACVKLVVARFELDALPAVVAFARSSPKHCADLVLPFVSVEVAELMARWLHLRSVRPAAESWLGRHPVAAVRALVPTAVGKAGRARRDAEAALRFIAGITSVDQLIETARDYGDDAVAAITAGLAVDPLDQLPRTIPEVDPRLSAHQLPQVLLRGRGHALPVSAVEHLLTMLAMSWPGEKYAGVDVVREHCDPASLAEFGWAVFERTRGDWQFEEARNDWAFAALRWLGDDDTVRRLTPLIRRWPGEDKHAKAVSGLDVLAAIGTETALVHLNSIAQQVKFKGLRTKAEQQISELADSLGLTADQLADRLVPDFGLDATGSLTLDYGPRRFTVSFDEHLKPVVTDQHGARLKTLPKPGARDDQNLAPAAHQRFTALKKDVRTVAADQIRRLERAMITQRRWRATEFHDLLVHHPLLWHITRRLAWTTGNVAFRIAEDRTLADVNDDTVVLPAEAQVSIAHPVQLGDTVAAWAEVFADYALLQPFPQLDRPVHRLTDDERASTELTRFHGSTAPTGKVLGLDRHGWERSTDEEDGIQQLISRPAPGNRAVVVNLSPGIPLGSVDVHAEQRIDRVWLTDRTAGRWSFPRSALPFGDLDPVTASEVLADLTALTSE